MEFIDGWPAWLRWAVLMAACLAMLAVVPLALSLGQWMADGMGPLTGWAYRGFSKVLAAVLPPALIVLLAWRVAPRLQLATARYVTICLVLLHVLGFGVAIAWHASGRDISSDPLWWSLTAIVLGAVAAVFALLTVMDMQAQQERAQLDLLEADRR